MTKRPLGFLSTFDLHYKMLMPTPAELLPETHPFSKALPLLAATSTQALHPW